MAGARPRALARRVLLLVSLAPLALAACRAQEPCRTAPATITPLAETRAPEPEDPGDLLAGALGSRSANGELRISPAQPDASHFFAGGWSSAERWQDQLERKVWRWSVGPVSRLRFSLDRAEPLVLSLEAVPFQPPGGRPQHVRVWLNDQYLTSLPLEPAAHVYEIPLPGPALRVGENVVRFAYLWTEQPARVMTDSPDQRDLAMAVAEVVIRPVGGATHDEPSLVAIRTAGHGEARRGLLPPRSGHLSMLAWPPAGSSLEVGWIRLGSQDGGRPPAYRVELEWDHGRRVLFEGVAERTDEVETKRVPLPAEADAAVRVHLSVEGGDGAAPPLAWVEPRIAPPPDDDPAVAATAPLRVAPETNLVFFLLDAGARDRFGVYGSTANTTPHVDLIARDSLVFDAAYTQASYTLASAASLFTSRLPSEHGVIEERDRLGPEWPTLAEALARSGYATAAFSANPHVSSAMRTTRGFARVDELFRNRPEGEVAVASEFLAPVRAWIEEQQRAQKPFFAYVHLIQPHEPYGVAPPDFYRGRLVPDYRGPFDGSQAQMRDVFRGTLHPGDADIAHIRGLYEGNLAYADAVVGELMGALGELGLWDRTLVVVTSDHGESLGERGIWGHGNSVDREQIRVPLVVHFPPGVITPHRRDDLVATIDVMPSLLGLLGAWEPPGMRGRSWFAKPQANAWPRPLPTIAEGRSGTVSVVVPGFKYSSDQATGSERLLALPDGENGENLRWERPVTFDWMAEQAMRLTAPRLAPGTAPAPAAAPELPADVKEALKALGYVE